MQKKHLATPCREDMKKGGEEKEAHATKKQEKHLASPFHEDLKKGGDWEESPPTKKFKSAKPLPRDEEESPTTKDLKSAKPLPSDARLSIPKDGPRAQTVAGSRRKQPEAPLSEGLAASPPTHQECQTVVGPRRNQPEAPLSEGLAAYPPTHQGSQTVAGPRPEQPEAPLSEGLGASPPTYPGAHTVGGPRPNQPETPWSEGLGFSPSTEGPRRPSSNPELALKSPPNKSPKGGHRDAKMTPKGTAPQGTQATQALRSLEEKGFLGRWLDRAKSACGYGPTRQTNPMEV